MTNWKEQARKHEESANEYARMNYELEATNAELLEALGRIAGVMSGAGLSKAQLRNQLDYAISTAKQALAKATA